MEEQLRKYRAKKRRQEIFNHIKTTLIRMVVPAAHSDEKKNDHVIIVETETTTEINNANKNNIQNGKKHRSISDNESIISSDDECDSIDSILSSSASNIHSGSDSGSGNNSNSKSSTLVYVTYLVYFLFWCTCFAIAIELQFGLVFLTISAICGIYLNTRTRPKEKNEISAYSVFNKDCHSIDGTLNAEQFDREIRYGPTSVR